MKSIHFYGASGTVTGSCYLLQKDSKETMLIDLGMYQGPEEITRMNQDPLQFNPKELEHVILTHAHLDHCGRLPLLAKHGFSGKVYMTEPTLDMLDIALHDAARIAQKDDKVPVIYNENHVEEILSQVEVVDFDTPFNIGSLKVTYKDAGHILGAASIHVQDDSADDGVRSLVFSGDLGNYPHNMLVSPHMFEDVDAVVMESTYGGRKHPHSNPLDALQEAINRIEETGGVLMIPCFAIERTQEMLYLVKKLKDAGKIKLQTPVFLDSPMAIKVTNVYRRYGALYNDDFHDVLGKFDPFDFPHLHLLERAKDGRMIENTYGPKVIIAGSGMMSGGRILKHAHKFISKPNNSLLFVGYQGESTMGRAILEGAQEVQINEITLPVKAQIEHIESMSAHADEDQLMQWLTHMKGVKKLFLTHGEDPSRDELESRVHKDTSISNIHKPQLNDEILLQ